MVGKPPVKRAVKAFEDFSGHTPRKVRTTRLDDRDVTGWQMGPAVGIAYEAKRDGKTQHYFHEFKKSARPNLVARDDGRQLYIEGGKYKVTDRGIEDMPQLFVVNPSPRKGRSKAKRSPMRRRRRTSTRRRATRQVAVFRANPVRRRRRRTTHRRYARNPSRRRYASNPIRRHRRRRTSVRRYRRNPSARGMSGGLGKMILPAMGIGAGAVGTEILMGWLPIPANFKTGVARHVTKGVVGIAAGLLLGKVLRQKTLGKWFAVGAVAIATHDALKEMIAARMPGVQLGGLGYRGPIRSSFGYINPAGTGRLGYIPPPQSSFGNASTQHSGAGETSFAV